MRRTTVTAALFALLVLAPLPGRAASSYSLILAGSRCASAAARSDGGMAAAWVCTGVQVAASGLQIADDPQGIQQTSTFGCISIANFKEGSVQRACGVIPDGALTGDPALQQGKIEFFLRRGESVLAARITLTGIGPYLNDHLLSEVGNDGSTPEHSGAVYAVARIYRMARLGGYIMGDGINASIRGTRGSLSTGVAGIAQADADPTL